MRARLRELIAKAKQQLRLMYIVVRHKRTPWYAKGIGVAALAYSLSPINFIPNWIPVVGWLDDLLLVPLAMTLMIRLVPDQVMGECRAMEAHWAVEPKRTPAIWAAMGLWLATASGIGYWACTH